MADAAETLWLALCMAPDEGIGIGELMRITGMSRPTLYRYLGRRAFVPGSACGAV